MIFHEPKPIDVPVDTPVRSIWGFKTNIEIVTDVREYNYVVDNKFTYDLCGFYVTKSIKRSKFFSVVEMKEIMGGRCKRIVPL